MSLMRRLGGRNNSLQAYFRCVGVLQGAPVVVGKQNKELLAAGLLPLAAKALLVADIHSLLAPRFFPQRPFS